MAKKIIAKKTIARKITSKTTLAKIIEKKSASLAESRRAAKILAENGVPCLSCPMSQFEIDKLEIGRVCKMYGLNLSKILKDLNK